MSPSPIPQLARVRFSSLFAEASNTSNIAAAGDAIGHGQNSTRLSRIALLMTMTELEEVIQMLRSVQHHVDISEMEGNELNAILDPLPENLPKPRPNLPTESQHGCIKRDDIENNVLACQEFFSGP